MKSELKITAMRIAIFAALVALAYCVAGCKSPQKMRDIELKGMYVNGYSEVLALGWGRLTSIPGDKEALAAHYEEDTAWLQPNVKTHKVDIFMVGKNSAAASPKIIEDICKAFAEVAPAARAEGGAATSSTTPLDVLKNAAEKRMERTRDEGRETSCTDGNCLPCADGSCNPEVK